MAEALKLLGRYAVVVAGAAAALLVLDAVPWLLSGAGCGVTTYRSVEQAERALGTTLLLVQTLDGDLPVPARLLPGGKALNEVDFDLDGAPARMTDVLLPPDGTFHDLSLVAKGRHVVFRFQGDPVTVLKMAASLPRGGSR